MKLLRFATWLVLVCPVAWSAPITLSNADWNLELDPATLAISVQPRGQKILQISSGTSPQRVSRLHTNATQADWQWENGIKLNASIQGRDLWLRLSADREQEVVLVQQRAAASGTALLLPLGEGRYIPRGERVIQDYLLQHQSEMNTSEDLSLPLWGMFYGNYSLSWILTNPFNNTLRLQPDGEGMSLNLRHRFTRLDLTQPMTWRLHLGASDDLLDGAHAYRQWLFETGRFTRLSDKLQTTPSASRLIGASHIYLWGTGPLTMTDVRDAAGFVALLRADTPYASALREQFDAETRGILNAAGTTPDRYQIRVLVNAVNQAMTARARSQWQVDAPDWGRLAEFYRQQSARMQAALGSALTPDPQRWGGSLSLNTMERLKRAGLTRLWLGTDSWEGGLWHPAAVRAGVAQGYLVGSYDSYETALPTGKQPNWNTAQMGNAIYKNCGVMQENGKLKSGFKQSGYYTNPDCVRPTLQARVDALIKASGYNSWFLDAYATGMVFDDYHPQHSMSQRQMAESYADSMQWVSANRKLVLGSENGNASTTRGLLFAHGMQVPVMAWGDVDMQSNRRSPYYLGRWYPDEQPEVFFTTVPLKQQYAQVFYNPAYRLPLYQAVFHDAVITSTHWLYDNFKFSNVDHDNRLTQMLYNVPPLYHLSADTIERRLPRIQCTDAFFRPVHQRLATQALSSFTWLSADRTLQQTRFTDGSTLQANFSSTTRQVAGKQLPAHSVTADFPDGQHLVFSTERCL
jgi:hypothetical protein